MKELHIRRTKRIHLLALLLLLALSCAACGQPAQPEAPPPSSRELAAIYVHGESALLYAEASYAERQLFPHLELWDGEKVRFLCTGEPALNKGLLLWQIPAGEYGLRCGEDHLAPAEDCYLPEGYSLTRGGRNQHWQFFRDEQGFLGLRVETVTELPEQVYDLLIDPGHGGSDPGACSDELVEAEENLRAALYMQELFTSMGLKVGLTREEHAIPGGEAAEDNPYAPGARVDQVYRKQAKYLLSSHLNAGGGSGFQLYSSVYTDTDWAGAVEQALLAKGWHSDTNGLGHLSGGLYKRNSSQRTIVPRDYYFILRETGGYGLSPYTYRMFRIDRHEELAVGAEALLLEYLFLDHPGDSAYWQANWKELVAAAVQGSAAYWDLDALPPAPAEEDQR